MASLLQCTLWCEGRITSAAALAAPRAATATPRAATATPRAKAATAVTASPPGDVAVAKQPGAVMGWRQAAEGYAAAARGAARPRPAPRCFRCRAVGKRSAVNRRDAPLLSEGEASGEM